MDHLLEVLKIIRHGVTGERMLVVAYAEMLANKLESDGEHQQAQRVRRSASVEPPPPMLRLSLSSNEPVDK